MSARAHEDDPPDAVALDRRPRVRLAPPLLLAAGCVGALALLWAIAGHVHVVRVADARILHGFTSLEGARVNSVAEVLLHLLNPVQFIIWAVALVLFAVARGRPRVALAIVVVLTLAPYTAELLKPLLAVSHASYGEGKRIGAASWPSGHATAATALALSAVLVVPARWRALALALAVAFLLLVGAGLLIDAWHMPSDVLGGYLLGTFWAALGLSGVRASERRWPSRAAGQTGRHGETSGNDVGGDKLLGVGRTPREGASRPLVGRPTPP